MNVKKKKHMPKYSESGACRSTENATSILHQRNVDYCDCERACTATFECAGFTHGNGSESALWNECYVFNAVDDSAFVVAENLIEYQEWNATCYIDAPRNNNFLT